ncbi:hypothetical protein [Hyphomonas sp.]|uniref:hypothetical protein n=1 Tax=Hyphomonas sp. TaxID=87 RepID=UPI00391B7455
MKQDAARLVQPVPTLSEAIEVAIPHMRALAAPLSGAGRDADSLVEAFVESVLYGAVWLRPPFRGIDMANTFRDDLISAYGEVEILTEVIDGPGGARRDVALRFSEYAGFVRQTFWEVQD